jgi:hypothetical protein
MTHTIQKLRNHAAAVILTVLFGALGAPLHALGDDINPQIANCEEITDPATQTQVDFCTAHVGCKLVMGIQKACTKVKTFLNNLKNLTFGKSKIDSNDVFDAAAPSAEGDVSFNNISRTIKSSYDKQPKKEIVSGKFESGVNWVYEGPMKDGVRNGTGVLITDSGTTFRGDFVEGRQAGLGEMFNDKSRKAGVMTGAKMNGTGVERYADGRRYEGEYKADKQDGKGVMTWKDGGRYEGNLSDGNRSGQGTYKWANGDQYTGNWVADKQQGRGTQKLINGIHFEGEFLDGKPYSGTQINANGSRNNIAKGLVVESSEQAVARITNNYDQRIAAAYEQCNSSKSSCDTGCAGVAAVGMLAMFAGGGAGAAEAGEQIQQCSNRCDDDKNSCDQQVSALEQEKSQTIAAAQSGNSSKGTSVTGGAPSGMGTQNCEAERQTVLRAGAIGVPGSSPVELMKFLSEQADGSNFVDDMPGGYASQDIRRRFPDIETNIKGLRVWAESDALSIQANSGSKDLKIFVLGRKLRRCLILERIKILEARR